MMLFRARGVHLVDLLQKFVFDEGSVFSDIPQKNKTFLRSIALHMKRASAWRLP